MKNKKEFLTEENYEKAKKKIMGISLIIFILGLILGGSLIFKGITNTRNLNSIYSEENKKAKIDDLTKQLEKAKAELESKKAELQAKGIKPSNNYESGDAYDLYIITNALDPSFSLCGFDEYSNNVLTSNYCSLKGELSQAQYLDIEFEKKRKNMDNLSFYMLGGFAILVSFIISFTLYMVTIQRKIIAFNTQQVMPIAQEGIEKMAPSIGKVAKEISKEIKEENSKE